MVTTLLVLVTSLTACTVGGAQDPNDAAPAGERTIAAPTVEVVGRELRLTDADGTVRTLAHTDPQLDGEIVHASLRPGERGAVTVLVLTRSPDEVGSRYELRYLVADDHGTTDLYSFPWRLQVDDGLVSVLDAPPLPVWSPDGASVAWVEWDEEGTRLRTVAWRDEGTSSNPSDDASAYRLDGVPPGTQLDTWEVGGDGVPVLRGTEGDTVWRIRLDVSGRAIAMADADQP